MTPGELIEVRVSWPEHPRYLKKKKKKLIVHDKDSSYTIFWFLEFGATVQ